MDLAGARSLSSSMHSAARVLSQARAQVDSTLNRTRWLGSDAASFRGGWARHQATLQGCVVALTEARTLLLAEIEQQQRTSDTGGVVIAGSSLVSGPGVPTGSGVTGGPNHGGDRNRDPDGRDGRRVENDRRTPGLRADNRTENGDFSNDWAGRAILDRYLSGGGDWTIDNDPTWTKYLTGNVSLTSQMADKNAEQARLAIQRYLETGQTTGSFDTTSSVAIENGEGMVGYQYLHGTNADVGGFKFSGNTTVTPRADGTYEVRIASGYQWNDVIDPNPEYSTDRKKSLIAEIITLGRADAYDIHIGWDGSATVVVDAQGNVVSGQGWPY